MNKIKKNDSKTALVNTLKFAIHGIDKLTIKTDIATNLSKPTYLERGRVLIFNISTGTFRKILFLLKT